MDKITKALGLKDNDAPRFSFRIRTVQPTDGEALYDLAQRNRTTAGNVVADPCAAGSSTKSSDLGSLRGFKDLAMVGPAMERAGERLKGPINRLT